MTVLVTGATGSLGRSLVARLLAEGLPVAVLTRRPFRAEALFGPEVAIHEWHPGSEPVPSAALAGTTGIVHLMGEPLAGWPLPERRELVRSSRNEPTRRLLDAIAVTGAPIRLVVASLALGLDGSVDTGAIIDAVSEAEVASAVGTTAAPAESADVLAWEEIARGAETAAVSVAIVRFGLIADSGAPLATLVALARRGLVADLRGRRIAAIDPADAAAMLAGLVQHPTLSGLIHGAAPVPVDGDALTRQLQALSALPWLPLVPVRLLGRYLGHAMPLLACRRPITPARLLAAGADFAHPDPQSSLDGAIAALANPPRSQSSSLWALLRRPRPAATAPE